ncbi:alanine racemase [Actinoalloteichus hymeniacidonis]|uniref:Amino acid aldolase or racemase n=1 Tax=Actinoalloteichus hymeniacidonis TaxID=340345 RepID=A0AAC9N0A8_9PSEU|nr:alanine racemase [Actinoalloteichus hymeniacidonis]AOS64741.1 putative amino acid aldolase or racemase [Actinoalloteichus hymeniacidonis]MBB5907183.1 D-serine deaminase-like pyridoxal phosphate-dependent protein [Actinoalloteichus hymeniacidonis]
MTARADIPNPALLDDGPIGWRFKGMPAEAAGQRFAELDVRGRNLFEAGFSWPQLVLRDSALRHNAELMADYTAQHGMSLAPHLKTTMSPELADYAMRAGAWGVTVANPYQARVFMAAGHQRILLANELVDRDFARQVAGWLAEDQARDFYCYVDSPAGVAVLADALADSPSARPLPVLIEVGHADGRAGCRDLTSVAAVRDAVLGTDRLALAGVSGYEGSVSHSRGTEGLSEVADFLRSVRAAMELVLPDADDRLAEHVVSAGGSFYFDVVAAELGGIGGPKPVRLIARPGAYLTHDHGIYHERSPLDGANPDHDGDRRLTPSIEVWAPVLSRPEPQLVILGAGRRDLNFDQGLPIPVEARDHTGGRARQATGWTVTALNDQHAFVTVPPTAEVGPSDLVRLGISHPCTAHDRWLAAVIASDDDTVLSVARCYF